MKYNTLLFDIDDTLLDFKATEEKALNQLFTELEVRNLPQDKAAYKLMNQGFWRDYELGKITREELLATRFSRFFKTIGREINGPATEDRYRQLLKAGHDLMPDSLTVVEKLSQTEALYIVTNGVSTTQRQRLSESGLEPYFKKVFISEELGTHKPEKAFFDHVFNEIPQIDLTKTVIIGDSLTSDIKGGQMAGIDTIWLNNWQDSAETIKPTYEITRLTELYPLLGMNW